MAPKPPTASASQPKKAPKASRAAKSKGGIRSTHTALGIAKKPLRNDKRTPKRRAADMARLEKTLPTLNTVVPAAASGKIKGGRGKIGKVFVDDHDADKLHRFVEQAAGKHDVGVESKLERAVCSLTGGRNEEHALTMRLEESRGHKGGPETRGREA